MKLSERIELAEAKRVANLPYGHISATCGCCRPNRPLEAKRDYWNSPRVAKWCRVLDWTLLGVLVAVVMVLGSIHI